MDGDKKPAMGEELSDEALGSVAGGATLHMDGDRYYAYVGSTSDEDWNASYLCPNCGNPVAYTGWGKFHCDVCDETWWFEYKLRLNLGTGMWQEISREEFMHRLRPEYR